MDTHMNPVYPRTRGCFIDPHSKAAEGKVVLADYPTWHTKNGNWVEGANAPIPDGLPWQKEFNSVQEAKAFAESENYLVCQLPRSLDPKRKDKKEDSSEDDE